MNRLRSILPLLIVVVLLGGSPLVGCTPDPVPPAPSSDGEDSDADGQDPISDMEEPDAQEEPDAAPEPDTGTPDTGTPDTGTPDMDSPDLDPQEQCAEYDYRGQVYNCAQLDWCGEQDFQFRLACCECNPWFCSPPEGTTCHECDVDSDCDPGYSCESYTCVEDQPAPVESCMSCHNGAQGGNDYSGPGLSNPHPFPGASRITCTGCHGGNPQGGGRAGSHVPVPPEIGDDLNQINDPGAWFNRLTLAGIDKMSQQGYSSPSHPGQTFTGLDYLQFVNPGDLRVVSAGRGCGNAGCHGDEHAQWVPRGVLATTTGFFSGWRFANGIDNRIPEYRGRDKDGDSLADTGFRAVQNPSYNPANRQIGEVGRLVEQPELAGFFGPMRDNAIYDSATLTNHIYNANEDRQRPNRVKAGSPLETLLDECTSIVCGDCHLGSAGANNRYADFRSSGCTACHMEYSYDGRSRSGDPNVNRQEPANPDAIAAPERPHVELHQIRNVARSLPNGSFVRGISDRACVGCHQGSNRTVLQFWGIRLDQNQDVVNELQYPANPADFVTTANDTRLYDPAVNNATFNGRVPEQHLLIEDYDGDGRDDTPEDVHYEAGMGCIDCHGSADLHGGTRGWSDSGKIKSRRDQQTNIQCESCHGTVEAYAPYTSCVDYDGQQKDCAVDREQNPLRHVNRGADGHYWLVSRVTGQRHYVPQTKDLVINTGRTHPLTSRGLYSPKASYAMGRADGNVQTGVGPQQNDPTLVSPNFSHSDTLECVACHGSWTNNCVGCHLKTAYDVDPNTYLYSNITGERILLNLANADFIYQTPVPFYLGVGNRGRITQISPAGRFFRHEDRLGVESAVLGFSDRLGEGNNPNNAGRNAFPGLNHYMVATHAIRGAATDTQEGARYCVSCHLTTEGLDNFGDEYAAFLDAYQNNDFANLDFDLLQQHIGQNTGNQLNSPLWVHMVSGQGSGLFLMDATGCPVNPLDENANRQYCPNGAPADNFDPNNVVYDLDRMVEVSGVTNVSTTHPLLEQGPVRRIGAANPEMAGPLGADRLMRLADPNLGLILDSWLDANGDAQGNANNYVP